MVCSRYKRWSERRKRERESDPTTSAILGPLERDDAKGGIKGKKVESRGGFKGALIEAVQECMWRR